MAITKNVGRQEALTGYIDIPYTELTTAGEFEVMNLPYGAQILSGYAVATGLTGVTNLAVSVEDGAGVELIADIAGTYGAGRVDFTPSGEVLSVPGYVKIDTTGNASAGSLRIVISYIVNGRTCVSEG